MQIVINIDENYYEIIKHDVQCGNDYLPFKLIAKGIPTRGSYEQGYNDAKREIALSGEYERCYERGKADAEKKYEEMKAQKEPCEDAISREAVNTLVDELARAISDERCWMSRGRSTATIMQDILDLPSAQPKTGRWVDDVAYYDEDGCPCIVSRCNQCGEANPKSNFCPNCGAKMEVDDADN